MHQTSTIELTILMPCLNEAETLAVCVNKALGNPVLSWIGRMLFRSPIKDFHCGLRGINRQSMLDLHLRTTDVEFASEMVVKSTLGGSRVSVPTTLAKDGRSRPPHLRSWRDGWRYLLIVSPRWLFLIPGSAAFVLGLIGVILLSFGPLVIGRIGLTPSSQPYLAALTVVGYQSLLFAILTKIYAQHEGFRIPRSRNFERLQKRISLESGTVVRFVLFLIGFGIALAQFIGWASTNFGPPNMGSNLRVGIPAALLMMLGSQTAMAGMFLGVLSVGVKRPA